MCRENNKKFLSEVLHDESPMPFGMYAGQPLKKVKGRYLLWLYDQTGFTAKHPALATYIDKNRIIMEREIIGK